jgi:hypothetical protein
MAATITLQTTQGNQPMAPMFVERVRIQGDSSYVTGGYALGASTLFPGKTVIGATMQLVVSAAGDIGAVYDRTNDKVKAIVNSTGVEVANGADATALDVELLIFAV